MPLGPERDALEDAWYQTYYGKTAEEINARRTGFMYGGNTGSLYGDVPRPSNATFICCRCRDTRFCNGWSR